LSGKRKRIVVVVTFVCLFVFLSLPIKVSRSVKEVITDFFYPVFSVSRSVIDKMRDIWEVTFHGDNIVRENLRKEREILRLRARLAEAREKVRELASLDKQLREVAESGFDVLAARVIGREADSFYQTLLIDRGTKDGVKSGTPVLYGDNLVGRVAEVGRRWSRVRLILDVRSAIPAMTLNGNVRGMVIGSGPGELKMTLIEHNAKLEVGDTVVSARLDNILNPDGAPLSQGLVIGKIASVSHEEGLYQSAILDSQVSFSDISEVLVVVSK